MYKPFLPSADILRVSVVGTFKKAIRKELSQSIGHNELPKRCAGEAEAT